jgi:hypothetical protein
VLQNIILCDIIQPPTKHMGDIMDSTRKSFEAWAKSEGMVLDRRMGSGSYTDPEVAEAWEVWKQLFSDEVAA